MAKRPRRLKEVPAADGRKGQLVMALSVGALLLLVTVDGADTNIPNCVTSITSILDQATEAAQNIAYATDSCNPMWWTPEWVRTGDIPPEAWVGGSVQSRQENGPGWQQYGVDPENEPYKGLIFQDWCANDILAVLTDLTGLAANAESSALYCSGKDDTGCPQQILSTLSGVFGFAKDTTGAISDCTVDRWACAGDIFDISSDLMTTIQNIQTGIDLCDFTPIVDDAPTPEANNASAPVPEPAAPKPEPAAGPAVPVADTTGNDVAVPQSVMNDANGVPQPVPSPDTPLSAPYYPGLNPGEGLERRLNQRPAHRNASRKEFMPEAQRRMYRTKFNNIMTHLDMTMAIAHNRLQYASLFKASEAEKRAKAGKAGKSEKVEGVRNVGQVDSTENRERTKTSKVASSPVGIATSAKFPTPPVELVHSTKKTISAGLSTLKSLPVSDVFHV